MTKPWKKYITMENLPNEDMRILAETIGIEPVRDIITEFPGIIFSIPANAEYPAKVEYIKNEYDGSKECRVKLSKLCGIGERFIYRMLSKKSNSGK